MSRISIIALFLSLAACKTTAPEKKDDPELVTRQSEPLRLKPKPRPKAQRVAVSDADFELVEDALLAETESNELVDVTSLQYAGQKILAVTHLRYPPEEAVEQRVEEALNAGRLERCNSQYPDCVDDPEACDNGQYEACMRDAYGDPFAFFGAYYGMECGVLEISRYERTAEGVTLLERSVLEEFACEFTPRDEIRPAATDLDGDEGPELVYTYGYVGRRYPEEVFTESLVVVDAHDLHVQARVTAPVSESAEEGNVITGLMLEDRNGDKLMDLVIHQVETLNYCGETGWALTDRFVVYEEDGEFACRMTVRDSVLHYDPKEDAWTAELPEGPR